MLRDFRGNVVPAAEQLWIGAASSLVVENDTPKTLMWKLADQFNKTLANEQTEILDFVGDWWNTIRYNANLKVEPPIGYI